MAALLPRIVLGLGLAALGAVSILHGFRQDDVTCSRAHGACEIVTGIPGMTTARLIRLEDIRAHRFEESRSRTGRRGVTVVLDARGAEQRMAEGRLADARDRYARIAAFLERRSDRVEVKTSPSPYSIALGALLLLASPFALRSSSPSSPRSTAAGLPPAAPWNRVVLTAIVVGIAGLAAATLLARSQGTLELRCAQRCEVAGLTCPAGGSTRMTLEAGEYDIRVFTPDAAATWTSHRIAIAPRRTTRFACVP